MLWHLKKGRYLQVDVAISYFISELYLQMDCWSHAKDIKAVDDSKNFWITQITKETWAVWPDIMALTQLASLPF